MIEKRFVDRVPTYPNRIKLTPVEGQADTYDLTRADEPRVEGTALDKTTFDSLIKSRLTGRYYSTLYSRTVNSSSSLNMTVSPLPTSGWVLDPNDTNKATNGAYKVESSSNQAAYSLADEVFTSGGWQSGNNSAGVWIMVYHEQAIKVKQISFRTSAQYAARVASVIIEGSKDGTNWSSLYNSTSVVMDTLETYTLTSTGEYNYYRLRFTFTDSNRVTVSRLAYASYDILTYTNAYNVSDNIPSEAEWTDGQRIMLMTSADVNTFAVTENTLDGVPIANILLPSKLYELIYSITSGKFVAREV